MSTFIKTDEPMTSALPGTRRGAGTALYKSVFNVNDRPSLLGSTTMSGPGLVVGTWEGADNALAIKDWQCVRGSGTLNWANGLILTDTAAMMSLEVVKLPTSPNLFIDIFRTSLTGTPDSYRLSLSDNGFCRLAVRKNDVNEYLSGSIPYKPGDRVGVRWVGGLLEAVINDQVVASELRNDFPPRGYAAISGGATTTGFILDNVDVDTY